MKRVKTIALNTFKETIRNKVLYSVIFFLILILSLSFILGRFTMGDTNKFVANFGFAGVELLGVIISIVIGIGLIYNEIQKKTIFTIISKPIKRWEIITGKFLGLSLTIFVQEFIMLIILFLFIIIAGGKIPLSYITASFLIYCELMIIVSVSIFFSTFSSPILSGFLAFTIYFIGQSIEYLKDIINETELSSVNKYIIDFFYYLLPNLHNLNIKNEVVNGVTLPASYISNSIIYAVAYILFMILTSTIIFERKQFY